MTVSVLDNQMSALDHLQVYDLVDHLQVYDWMSEKVLDKMSSWMNERMGIQTDRPTRFR